MAGSSNTTANALLKSLLRGVDYTKATSYYVALLESAATKSMVSISGVETDYTNYARQAFACNATNWTNPTTGAMDNAVAIAFPTCGASGGVITHFALMTAATSGTLVAWGDVSPDKTIAEGDTPEFAIGALDVTLI